MVNHKDKIRYTPKLVWALKTCVIYSLVKWRSSVYAGTVDSIEQKTLRNLSHSCKFLCKSGITCACLRSQRCFGSASNGHGSALAARVLVSLNDLGDNPLLRRGLPPPLWQVSRPSHTPLAILQSGGIRGSLIVKPSPSSGQGFELFVGERPFLTPTSHHPTTHSRS